MYFEPRQVNNILIFNTLSLLQNSYIKAEQWPVISKQHYLKGIFKPSHTSPRTQLLLLISLANVKHHGYKNKPFEKKIKYNCNQKQLNITSFFYLAPSKLMPSHNREDRIKPLLLDQICHFYKVTGM